MGIISIFFCDIINSSFWRSLNKLRQKCLLLSLILFIVFKRQPRVLGPFVFRQSGKEVFLSRIVRDSQIRVEREIRLRKLISADHALSWEPIKTLPPWVDVIIGVRSGEARGAAAPPVTEIFEIFRAKR